MLSIEGTKLFLRGSKKVLAGLVALIRYSSDKLIPARKCRDFLLSTSNVRFMSMSDENIEKFKVAARPYGLKYLHIHDSNGDGMSTLMVRGEDAAIINRLIERNNLDILSDVTHEEIQADLTRATEVNGPIPEIVVDRDGVRVQDTVQASRTSAQELIDRVEEANPVNGRMVERQDRPSENSLQPSAPTSVDTDTLWNDVSASIDNDFEVIVKEKRNRKLELYNQEDPLLQKAGTPKRSQPKPSVRKGLERKKDTVRSMKQERVKAALEKQQTARQTMKKSIQR